MPIEDDAIGGGVDGYIRGRAERRRDVENNPVGPGREIVVSALDGRPDGQGHVLTDQAFQRNGLRHGDGLRIDRIVWRRRFDGNLLGRFGPSWEVERQQRRADAQIDFVEAFDGYVVSGARGRAEGDDDLVAALDGGEDPVDAVGARGG